MPTEKATFAAGCFWGVQLEFDRLPGVEQTIVGYTGGHTANPTYQEVCTGTTGHAEVVEITFDPSEVSFLSLLEIFWSKHNPTTLNRQGPDVGSQYRSAIFVHTPEQQRLAENSRQKAQARFMQPIVTEITAASTFYPAEEYHQHYLKKRGIDIGCH